MCKHRGAQERAREIKPTCTPPCWGVTTARTTEARHHVRYQLFGASTYGIGSTGKDNSRFRNPDCIRVNTNDVSWLVQNLNPCSQIHIRSGLSRSKTSSRTAQNKIYHRVRSSDYKPINAKKRSETPRIKNSNQAKHQYKKKNPWAGSPIPPMFERFPCSTSSPLCMLFPTHQHHSVSDKLALELARGFGPLYM